MSKESSSAKLSRINRLEISINVVIQTILVVFIVGVVNFAGFHYFKIWDVSRDSKRTLSDKTLQVLKTLPPEVKVIALFSPRDPLNQDIQNLLKDVRTASGNKLEIEMVNQFVNLERASELQKEFKLGEEASVLIATHKGKKKFIYPVDMTEWDRSQEMYGQPPRPTAFKGEQLLASALIEVAEEKPRKLYILAGHGESDVLRGDNFNALRVSIDREGVRLEPLNLLDAAKVPEDASAILIAGPKLDLSQREIELLTEYWKGKGRLLIMLNPDGETPRLDQFLAGIGIKPENNRVLGRKKSAEVEGMVVVENRAAGMYVGDSPITKNLKGVLALLPAPAKSLTLREEVLKTQSTKLMPLFMTVTGYWGEFDYNAAMDKIQFDEGKDIQGPLVIFAQAEKGAVGDQRVQLDSSRLVVTGNSLFVDGRALDQAGLLFAVSAVNWLTDREELIGVPPKEYKLLNLDIKDEQMSKLTLLVLIVMPFSAALAGLLVWWRRRN